MRLAGCIYSILLRDTEKANSWLLINAWQSSADLEKWQAMPAEAALRAKARTILDGPVESVGTFTELHL